MIFSFHRTNALLHIEAGSNASIVKTKWSPGTCQMTDTVLQKWRGRGGGGGGGFYLGSKNLNKSRCREHRSKGKMVSESS